MRQIGISLCILFTPHPSPTSCVSGIEFPPTIKEIPSQVFVSPGKGTNLTCKASGFPLPLVWWSTAGSAPVLSPTGSGGIGFHVTSPIHYYAERALTEPQPQEATLRLTDITDQLTYICVAKNSLGIVRRNISVIVKRNNFIICFLKKLNKIHSHFDTPLPK